MLYARGTQTRGRATSAPLQPKKRAPSSGTRPRNSRPSGAAWRHGASAHLEEPQHEHDEHHARALQVEAEDFDGLVVRRTISSCAAATGAGALVWGGLAGGKTPAARGRGRRGHGRQARRQARWGPECAPVVRACAVVLGQWLRRDEHRIVGSLVYEATTSVADIPMTYYTHPPQKRCSRIVNRM